MVSWAKYWNQGHVLPLWKMLKILTLASGLYGSVSDIQRAFPESQLYTTWIKYRNDIFQLWAFQLLSPFVPLKTLWGRQMSLEKDNRGRGETSPLNEGCQLVPQWQFLVFGARAMEVGWSSYRGGVTQMCFEGRAGYIICRVQWKMKMSDPC